MTARRFKVVLEWDSGDSLWVTYVPALNHLSTFGETREAILGYLETASAEGIQVPEGDAEIELTEVEVVSA